MSEATLEMAVPRRPRMEPFQIVLVFVAVLAASFLAGVLVAATMRPAGPAGSVIARGDIDASGGTIRFSGGQIVVPSGATRGDVHIEVHRSKVQDRLRVQLPDEPMVIEPGELYAYRFTPTDVVFDEPVEITFRLPADARNGTVFVRTGDEIDHLDGTIDPARATATIRVRDFRFVDR